MQQFKQRQSGAALIVGLVLLAILTLLTATSMNSSTVSLRMADNVKQADLAFKATETALNNEFLNGGALTMDGTVSPIDPENPDDPLINNIARAPADIGVDVVGDSSPDITVSVVTILEDELQPGFGTGLGNEAGANMHFEIQGAATAGRGARSSQRLGFSILVPQP
ncbi:MAG: hypothetical protein HKN70_06020 [Gammaproteobacteria bacterium]|nr:hypothetical protein [Gammaproteobacteria bacterium]